MFDNNATLQPMFLLAYIYALCWHVWNEQKMQGAKKERKIKRKRKKCYHQNGIRNATTVCIIISSFAYSSVTTGPTLGSCGVLKKKIYMYIYTYIYIHVYLKYISIS